MSDLIEKEKHVRGAYAAMNEMTQVFWNRRRRAQGVEEVSCCETDIMKVLLLWNRMGEHALPLFSLIKLELEEWGDDARNKDISQIKKG